MFIAPFGSEYFSWLQNTFGFSWTDSLSAGETSAYLFERQMEQAAIAARSDICGPCQCQSLSAARVR